MMKMIFHFNQVPAEVIRDCILDVMKAEMKAFPKQNRELWSKLVPQIPEDLLTRKEKEKLLNTLPNIESEDSEIAINKLLVLMERRISNRRHREKLK